MGFSLLPRRSLKNWLLPILLVALVVIGLGLGLASLPPTPRRHRRVPSP